MSPISFIIPVYRAADYIETCAVSLLGQTYPDIEYIFVDDSSPDNSVEILMQVVERFPQRKGHFKLIRMSRNSGSATARNVGLDAATGKYVMFADSDDWLELTYVADMVAMIESDQADIVYCDYFETYKDKSQYVNQNNGTDASNCISAMLKGVMHGSTWNKIYRRSFLVDSHQRFVDGADLFEDVGWNVRLFALADKIGYLHEAYYHYLQFNEGSIIKSMQTADQSRIRVLQRIRNVEVACKFLDGRKMLDGTLAHATKEWKLMAKNDLLTDHPFSWLRWMVAFPEADSVIVKCDKITWNYKLLLLYLHHRCLWLYRVHRALLKRI